MTRLVNILSIGTHSVSKGDCAIKVLLIFPDEDTVAYKNVDYDFHQRFDGLPKDEKLVCYYSCR